MVYSNLNKGKMFTKNQKVPAYIAKQYSKPSVTSLMKLCYLVDLVSMQKEEDSKNFLLKSKKELSIITGHRK